MVRKFYSLKILLCSYSQVNEKVAFSENSTLDLVFHQNQNIIAMDFPVYKTAILLVPFRNPFNQKKGLYVSRLIDHVTAASLQGPINITCWILPHKDTSVLSIRLS